MNTKFLRSSSQYIQNPLDCRRVTLFLRFYQFTEDDVQDLSRTMIQWVNTFLKDDFVSQWFFDGKDTGQKNILRKLQEEQLPEAGRRFGFEAYVRNPVVDCVKAMKKFQRQLRITNPVTAFGWDVNPFLGHESVDYPAFINQILPLNLSERHEILRQVYRVFNEPNRKYMSFHTLPDFTGSFSASSYHNISNQYYGHANLSFSAFSLGNAVNDCANLFLQFAQHLCEKYEKINAHIGLQPFYQEGSPYMRYFGEYPAMDGSHMDASCTPKEWYPTYYLCGIEWANFLSPLTKQHLDLNNLNVIHEDNIIIHSLSGGGVLIRSAKAISEYDHATAHLLKKYILPSLYPGRSHVPLRGLFPRQGEWRIYDWCPRFDWAIVPIEEQEFDIVGTNLVYQGTNFLNIG